MTEIQDNQAEDFNSGRLIEKTVVGAFRDWIRNHGPTDKRSTVVELGSKTENKIGDALLRNKEKIYLFEIKSTNETIKEEWNDGRKNSNSKLLSEIVRIGGLDASSFSKEHLTICSSLACHHFLYWSPTESNCLLSYGHLIVEPYVKATARLGGFATAGKKDNLQNPELESGLAAVEKYYPAYITDNNDKINEDSTALLKTARFTITQTLSETAVIACDNGSLHSDYLNCGLELAEFQTYVNFLCGNENHAIHALVISQYGTLIELVRSTSNLKSIFDSIDNDATPPPPPPEQTGPVIKGKKFKF